MHCEQSEFLQVFRRELVIKKYSSMTVRNYLSIVKKYLEACTTTPVAVNIEYIKRYILDKCDKNYSANTIALLISALKAFYRMVLKSALVDELHQPKRSKTLPYILDHGEIMRICTAIKNRKHKCMIGLMYSSGLRVGELVNLRVRDIDFENLRLMVRSTKGNKHRITIFSDKLVDALRSFIEAKQENEYVFTSALNKKYGKRTVQAILEKALKTADLKKHASCHVLRHSFATHLVEDGVNILSVQKLLGHSSIKTTMIYTKLARHALKDIKSPL